MTGANKKRKRPRLVPILAVFLQIQAVLLLVIGLNLFTDDFVFLRSWQVFWDALREAFRWLLHTAEIESGALFLYDVVISVVLSLAALVAFLTGLAFFRENTFAWVLSQIVQILTLVCGIGLYFLYAPFHAYALMVLGIFMVIYLNNSDVRIWFLRLETQEASNA